MITGSRNLQDEPIGGLFSIKGMVHADDPETSVAAAHGINECKTKLHDQISRILRFSALTDEELETLGCFVNYGPSTIRKRRSELYQAGRIKTVGERRNSRGHNMKVWAAQ